MADPISLILGGIQVAGGIAGAVQGNQSRQRAKGEIGRAYRLGQQRLALQQGDQRQSGAESLVARGLAQGGNVRVGRAVSPQNTREVEWATNRAASRFAPVRRLGAANPVTPIPAVSVMAARDLGGQATVDLRREQQLEQNALKQQRDAAIAGANAAATQALVGGIGQAVAGGIQGFQTGQMYQSFRGIDPVDPLRRGAWAQPAVDALNIYNRQG